MFLPSLKSRIILVLLIISAALTILAVFLITHVIPGIIKSEIFKNVRLVRGTEQFDNFVEIPFPLSFEVYLFNVENPDGILKGEKPALKEVGPYVYKEHRRKTINHKNEEKDTISYREREIFEFDKEASGNLSDTDFVTMLNLPLIGTLQIAEDLGEAGLISQCLSDIFPNMSSVFIKVRVKDALFDGLRFCIRHFSLCEIPRTIVCRMCETKKNVEKLPDDSLIFSFFRYKNNTDDALFTMRDGIDDVRVLGRIVSLNNSIYTHFWRKSSKCDQINGTYGTVFPPQIEKNYTFDMYSTDICRSVKIEFIKEDSYKDIKGYMFSPNNLTLRSKDENETEDCFCDKQTKGVNREETCFLDGVVDLQPCIDAPVLLSFPHFLWADTAYLEAVDGILPNEELHRTFLLIEPDTGTPLQAKNRIQMNAVLRPISGIRSTTNLPRTVLPLLWVEEDVSLPDKYINKLKESYFDTVKIVDISKWAFLGITSTVTVMLSTYFIWQQRSS